MGSGESLRSLFIWNEKLKFERNEFKSKQERIKIMDKVLVVVFDSENKAYEGSLAFQDLQNEGSINLYAKAVIARDANGKVTVKQTGDMGPVGTAVGLLTGSLIGLLGGPVGVVIGVTVGTSGGLLYDLAQLGVSEDYLNEVGKSLLPGKAAVVAEAWEEWTLPVDSRMEALGGVVFRSTRMDIVDDQMEKDVAALNADLDELEAEYAQASAEAKKKLQTRIDNAKAKLRAAQDAMQARLSSSQQETEAKIQSLEKQAAKAHGERKAKLEKRIAELKAEQKRRSEQLKQKGEEIKKKIGV
jgi:uncharacterized membrane protein